MMFVSLVYNDDTMDYSDRCVYFFTNERSLIAVIAIVIIQYIEHLYTSVGV